MNETLISACTMFLVPATLLFGALGVANSSFLKVLVCLLGVATTGIWLYRIWWWTNLSLIDRRTALGLAGSLGPGAARRWRRTVLGGVRMAALRDTPTATVHNPVRTPACAPCSNLSEQTRH